MAAEGSSNPLVALSAALAALVAAAMPRAIGIRAKGAPPLTRHAVATGCGRRLGAGLPGCRRGRNPASGWRDVAGAGRGPRSRHQCRRIAAGYLRRDRPAGIGGAAPWRSGASPVGRVGRSTGAARPCQPPRAGMGEPGRRPDRSPYRARPDDRRARRGWTGVRRRGRSARYGDRGSGQARAGHPRRDDRPCHWAAARDRAHRERLARARHAADRSR